MSGPRVEVVDPGGDGLPASELWAWVAVHGVNPDGTPDESIIAVQTPDGGARPLVAQQEREVRRWGEVVQRVVDASGKGARLVRYSAATVVDELLPGSTR